MRTPSSETIALLRNFPAFRTAEFGSIEGWKELLIDAGLDLYLLGKAHQVEFECQAAMSADGRLQLCFTHPEALKPAVAALRKALEERSTKICQYCGKPAIKPSGNRHFKAVCCSACAADLAEVLG